jgi:hypothetical protein
MIAPFLRMGWCGERAESVSVLCARCTSVPHIIPSPTQTDSVGPAAAAAVMMGPEHLTYLVAVLAAGASYLGVGAGTVVLCHQMALGGVTALESEAVAPACR